MARAISKKLRFEVFKRDGFCCVYCGAHPSEEVFLEVDHIIAVKNGGTDEMDNLVAACFACNRGKSATPLSQIPQSMKSKAEEVKERESQVRAFNEIMEARKARKDAEAWSVAEIFMARFSEEDIQRTRFASIRTFLGRLNVYEVQEAMEMACDKMPYSKERVFRYFCGICWGKIKSGESNGAD